MQGAARPNDDVGIDLEAHAAQAIDGGKEALRQLLIDPQNADAVAAVHMWGAHLEDIRQAICDLKLTGAMMELAVQAGREAGCQDRDGRKPRRRAPRRDVFLRIVRG